MERWRDGGGLRKGRGRRIRREKGRGREKGGIKGEEKGKGRGEGEKEMAITCTTHLDY